MENETTTPAVEAPPFLSKEYWLIICLIALGFAFLKVTCERDGNGKPFLLWAFPATPEVLEIERKYYLRESINVNLQKVIAAAMLFKDQMRYFGIH